MKRTKNFVTAAVLAIGLATSMHAQISRAMDDKMPMGGKGMGAMSMSDKEMMPKMTAGMSASDKSMMMKAMPMMTKGMSAADKKTLAGMSLAERQMCMRMCMRMNSKMAMPAKKPAAKKPLAKKPAAKKPMPSMSGGGGMSDM